MADRQDRFVGLFVARIARFLFQYLLSGEDAVAVVVVSDFACLTLAARSEHSPSDSCNLFHFLLVEDPAPQVFPAEGALD